jgi:cell division protein FtsW
VCILASPAVKRIKLHKRNFLPYDKTFLVLVVILTILGLISVANASAPLSAKQFGDIFFFVKQQALWACVGFVALGFTAKIDLSIIKTYGKYIFYGAILLLIIVLIPGVGTSLLGAKRWIIVGPFSLQPAEVAKFALVIYLAQIMSEGKQIKQLIVPPILVMGLVMLQPDLGTTLVIAGITFAQLFVGGLPLIHFGILTVGGIGASLLLILFSDYRRARLMTFLSETTDPLGHGYHIRQILLALGSGGLFGVGLGHSRQKHLFLPETANDSIFAIIAEELGFFGSLVLIMLFGYFIYRCILIARNTTDPFHRMLAVGITGWIGGQMILNIGSMVALTPLTGIPLPFFSYGGTALVGILAACGIMLNISRHTK